MGSTGTKADFDKQRLAGFLDSHDLHLLADSTQAVHLGSIYRRIGDETKAKVIGNVSNFIVPAITLPESEKGSQNVIDENFRNSRSLNLIGKFVMKFVASLGFSIGTSGEQVLEVNYQNVTYEVIDDVTFSDLFFQRKLKTTNMQYDPTSEYYVVTKVVKSPKFRVNVKLDKGLKASIHAKGGLPLKQGEVQIDYAQGTFDEVTMTHSGEDPLVFAVHLEKILFDKANGVITGMNSLTEVLKLLGKRAIGWE